MSWNKVCPPKTWASRLHHEVMNIGRSHSHSSTTTWVACAQFRHCEEQHGFMASMCFWRVPGGSLLASAWVKTGPRERKRKCRLMICAKKVEVVLLLPRWHNKQHCSVTSSNLWRDSEQPEFVSHPFAGYFEGSSISGFWFEEWPVVPSGQQIVWLMFLEGHGQPGRYDPAQSAGQSEEWTIV